MNFIPPHPNLDSKELLRMENELRMIKKNSLGKLYKSDKRKTSGIYGASLSFITSDVYSLFEGMQYSYTHHHLLENVVNQVDQISGPILT